MEGFLFVLVIDYAVVLCNSSRVHKKITAFEDAAKTTGLSIIMLRTENQTAENKYQK